MSSYSTPPITTDSIHPRRPLPKRAIEPTVTQTFDDDTPAALEEAREIVRRAQCPQCSLLLDTPMTLPCGNTLCRKCIPTLFIRKHITYPGTEDRKEGFRCPFTSCGLDHATGDCSVSVVLNKIMSSVRDIILKSRNSPEFQNVVLRLEILDGWDIPDTLKPEEKEPVRNFELAGGRIVSMYTLAEAGELPYYSDVKYIPLTSIEHLDHLDLVVLESLKEATRLEVDCQICYTLLYDPYTMTCGHTFCRKCLHQILDHSNLCPVCRRRQAVPPGVGTGHAPTNVLLSRLVAGLCPLDLAIRAEGEKQQDQEADNTTMPLFICTISFPNVPTFLHIFEPRYRLMIRRAIESGDRKFGMLLPNPRREPQGELGTIDCLQYGTLLHIVSMHLMPDGRSLIETVGVSRFKVLRVSKLDGYTVGKIQRVDDVTLSEEETIEARETAPIFSQPSSSRIWDIETASTSALFEYQVAFVKKMQNKSAPWLHQSVIFSHGEIPTDMAQFSWWFAGLVPVDESEKYKLLSTTSVRERLKITALWVKTLENRTWGESSGCSVL